MDNTIPHLSLGTIPSRCPVCDSPNHFHCSLGCEMCDDGRNPHPTFAEVFCAKCRKSLCFRCFHQHPCEEVLS
jgi:hypothetical protein